MFCFQRHHIKECIAVYFNKEDRNRLVSSVYNYVNNSVYVAGCRALGISDKLLTGPSWRLFEKVEHILDLNDTWLVSKIVLHYFQKIHIIDGKIFYPEFTKDEVFNCLFNVENEELNILTMDTSNNFDNFVDYYNEIVDLMVF